MKSPFEWLSNGIQTRPFLVAAVTFAVIMLVLYGMTMLAMETGTDTYIDKTTTRGSLLSHYTDTYSSDAIMIIIEADDVFTPAAFEYMDRLEEDIRDERYIDGVSGIIDAMKTVNGGSLPRSKAEISRIEGLLPPSLLEQYAPSNLMTIISVGLEPGVSNDVQKQVLNNIDSLISLSDPPPGYSITVSGSPAFSKEMEEEMGSSMGILILTAMLLMVLAVMLLFSHVSYRLLPVFVVGVGLVTTFGVMGLLGIDISMVVIGAFPVLIGIGIDYAIQIHSRIDEVIQHSSLKEAINVAVTSAAPSVMVAMGATSMGFIAMFFSPIPMVMDFGLCCVIGVVCCYIAALIIVPTFAMIAHYKPKLRKGTSVDVASCELDWKGCDVPPVKGERCRGSLIDRYNHMLGEIACRIARNPVPVLLIFCVVAGVGMYLDTQVPINTDEETFVPQDMPALVDMKKVTRVWGSTDTIPIIIAADNVMDTEILEWMLEFGEYESTGNDRITGVSSIATLLAEYNGGSLPATDQELAAVLDQIPDSTKKRYLNGNTEAVIQFSTVSMESQVARSMIDDLSRDLDWYIQDAPPGVSGHVTGTMEMFAALIEEISDSKAWMTFLGFAMIFGFLLLVYRRINAVSPLIPIVLIVGWNGAIMYSLGLDYTPMTAVLGSMTIGVASEYTILIMERCQEELVKGLDIYEAIQTSVQKIGMSITVSGLTTVFGFSALTLSAFNMISNFGIVTVITVGFSLIGAIVVMPAVLVLMHKFTGPRDQPQAADAASS